MLLLEVVGFGLQGLGLGFKGGRFRCEGFRSRFEGLGVEENSDVGRGPRM